MKSFKQFISEKRSEEIEKLTDRERLKRAYDNALTDDQMRSQNPQATKAYEDDVKERRARRTVTVDTPEGQITAGGTSRGGKIPIQTPSGETIYVTPDEAVARAEARLKPSVKNKTKKIVSRSNASTQSAPTPAPAPTKPKPEISVKPSSVSLSLTRTPAPTVVKGPALSVTKSKVKQSVSAKNLGQIVTDVMKTERQARAAEKAASAAKAAKAIGRVGTLGAVVSSGIEAKGEFDRARREGASRNRAFGAGVARALGGLGGSALGALGGGAVAGLPGAFIGGTAGYTGGANLASSAYKQITGDNKQKLTTQRVLSNIRKTVPLEVRREIPAGARKAFRDLVTQTGRTYGNWRRSQEK